MKERAGLASGLAWDPEITLFVEPDSGFYLVRVSYRDELVKKIQEETGATFVIITHNIASVMPTSDYIAVLYRAGLVKFASKSEMRPSDDAIIPQFLAGRAAGPTVTDPLAPGQIDMERDTRARASALREAQGPA